MSAREVVQRQLLALKAQVDSLQQQLAACLVASQLLDDDPRAQGARQANEPRAVGQNVDGTPTTHDTRTFGRARGGSDERTEEVGTQGRETRGRVRRRAAANEPQGPTGARRKAPQGR